MTGSPDHDRRAVLRGGSLMLLGATTPAAQAAPAAGSNAGQLLDAGISRRLAEHRGGTLSDVSYDVRLDLTGTDTAPGTIEIRVTRAAAAGDLILDFRGVSLTDLVVNGSPVDDARAVAGHRVIAARHLKRGANVLTARFASRIAASGAALIRFTDPVDKAGYLYTLFVPQDANLLFPCFDQPDVKARIRWTLVTPRGWTAFANSRVERRTEAAASVEWRFEPTPPIPTYVASFAAGPWRAWESAPSDARPITLYARQSRADDVARDADDLIRSNRRSLDWLEDFLTTPYPFTKFDMLIAPGFPLGGMEHVASIYYNESGILFREPPSLSQKLNREQIIYHEVSHQWFGNFVTMTWFDDLWLKEGFSTFISAYLQAALEPGSEPWKTFYLRLKPSAYNVEVSRATAPLWQELPNLSEAGGNYGPIVYNKAPAVLKQLTFLIGEEKFRTGLRAFLARYAYGNATWRDLMKAMASASGQPLEVFGEQYFLRAGMARVDADLTLADGKVARLMLRQRPAAALPGGERDLWPMKLRVRLGYADRDDVVLPAMLTRGEVDVPGAAGLPAPDYVWANDGDYGYGLFTLDRRSAAYVAHRIGSVRDGLLRVMLWGALWEEVRERRMHPQAFVRIALRELPGERDEQISRFVMTRAGGALAEYIPEECAGTLAADWERLLLGRVDDPALDYGMRKDALDTLVSEARTPAGLTALRDYLAERRRFDGAPVRQVTRWNIVRRLLVLDVPDAAALYAAEVARDRTSDAARMAFIVGAARADAGVKRDYYRRYLEDTALNEAWAAQSFVEFNVPEQVALTRSYLASALTKLEWIRDNRTIAFLPLWINAFVGSRRDAGAVQIVDDYLRANPRVSADISRQLIETRDDVARAVAIRTFALTPEPADQS